VTIVTLTEAVQRDPRLLALRSIEELQVSLERNTRNVPQDGRFHVRVRGRTVFSGSYAAAQARFDRVRDAQLCRKLMEVRRGSTRRFPLEAVWTVRIQPVATRANGRYAGQRRGSRRPGIYTRGGSARPSEPPHRS
jgi:hypothetical protein